MITQSFDNQTPAIISPRRREDAPQLDALIITFSYRIEQHVKEHDPCREIAALRSVTEIKPVYRIDRDGPRLGFYKTDVGAPATVGFLEDALAELDVKRVIMFGGAGCLDKDIARGKIMIPTEAFRDEGTSYHYAPAADFITVKNASVVADFMQQSGIPYVLGKTWTTDAIYRETRGNFEKRRQSGCISVEMECAAVQALCDFRGIEFFCFLKSGDLLDAPEWDPRSESGQNGSQHDPRYFELAVALADFVCRS